MDFWSETYSWIEFLGAAAAAFVGVAGAIWAAMWQVRKQEGLSAKELHDQMTVQAARELTTAIVDLDNGLEKAWRSDGLPIAASVLDKYDAAITAAAPVLNHVGLRELALSTRTDANLFLRAWRQVETVVREPLHDSRGESSANAAEEFSHEWLLGHSRGLARHRSTREVSLAWLRDAPVWTGWINCSQLALLNLSEQTLQGSQGFVRTVEVEALPFWTRLAEDTALSWTSLPTRQAPESSDGAPLR